MTRDPERDPRLDAVRAAAGTDDRLDDVSRARIWSGLDRALDAEPRRPNAGGARRRRRAGWVAATALCATAAGVALWLTTADRARPRGPVQVLDVPAGASVHAQLGPAAAVTLYGAARLVVADGRGDVDVALDRGALAGDYDHARGGRLRIRTPHATVEIVGTVFAVEVGTATCVSVAHGLVEVRARVRRRLAAGASWCTDAPALRPIPPVIEARMAEHAGRAIVAAAEPVASPPVAPLSAVEPPLDEPPLEAAPSLGEPLLQPARPVAAVTPGRRPAPELEPEPEPELAPPPEPAPEPPPEPVPPRKPAVAAGPDAELYAAAEAALRNGDTEQADALLAHLVVDHPGSDLLDEALFERARLAYRARRWTAAGAILDQLLDGPPSPLRAPARLLACRIAVQTRDRDAAACLDQLRRDHPTAAFATEVLELRVQVAFDRGGCKAAAPFLTELVAAAPRRTLTTQWQRRCQEAPR